MKKCFAVLLTMVVLVSSMGVTYAKADLHIKYSSVQVSHKGRFYKEKKKSAYSKIVRSYKQLNQLKKYVKKNFVKKKMYANALSKYKKSFFKKNALVFAADVFNAANAKSKLADVEKKNNTIRLHVDRIYAADKPMIKMFISHTNTYLITVKKKDIKGAKKVKVKYTGVPYVSSTPEVTVVPGTDATATVAPTASTVASSTPEMSTTPAPDETPFNHPCLENFPYDNSQNQACQLIVQGRDLSGAGCHSMYNPIANCAEIPIIPTLMALGARVEWENDNVANISFKGENYIFNQSEKTLINVKYIDSSVAINELFQIAGSYYQYYDVIEGEAVVDSESIRTFLESNGISLDINREDLTVVIYDPNHRLTEYDTSSHRECQLLVDDIDLTAAGHYARINPEMRCAEIPLVAVLEALGAAVEWESENTANITYFEERYILNKENKTFLHEDGYNILLPPPGNDHASYFEVINGEVVVDGCSMMLILSNDRRNVIEDFDNNIVTVRRYK